MKYLPHFNNLKINHQFIIKGIEIIALGFIIVIILLWINNPSGPFEPYLAFGTTFFLVTDMIRRFNPKRKRILIPPDQHVKVNFNSKNVLFTRFKQKGNERTGNIALMFYGMQISNISDRSFTIKAVNLEFEFLGETINEISHTLITGSIYSSSDKSYLDSIILKLPKDQVIFMDWKNIRNEIYKNRVLNPGEILTGSAIYVLNIKEEFQLDKIVNPRFIIEDYSGNISSHPIRIIEDWKRILKVGYIEPKKFKQDEGSEIEFQ